MKNKHNIKIIKIHTPKIKTKELPNITFAPTYGGIKSDIFKISKGYSDIIITDIGPSFNNISETLSVLYKFKTFPMRRFKWIDHHKWPQDIITKYRNYLCVSNSAESCAELIDMQYIESLSRTIIFYGADCDGMISAALIALGKSISIDIRNELIKIARDCDTANFFNNNSPISMIFHKAVYMARVMENSAEELNKILHEIINWASDKLHNIKKYLSHTYKLMAKYDEVIMKTNQKIISNPIFNTDNIKVFNTAHVPYADLSYICSYLYKIKCKYVLFVNSGGITINSGGNNIDLTKEFDCVGIKHKVFLPNRRLDLGEMFNIILKLERIER